MHLVLGNPGGKAARIQFIQSLGGCNARRLRLNRRPGFSANSKDRRSRACCHFTLDQLDNPVLRRPSCTHNPRAHFKGFVSNGRGKVHGQRKRFADAIRVLHDGIQKCRRNDTPERTDKICIACMYVPNEMTVVAFFKLDGCIERVRFGCHRISLMAHELVSTAARTKSSRS